MEKFKVWLKCALIRAIKTMAQTAGSLLVVGATMQEIEWITVGSASLLAGIISLVTSVAGIPEAKIEEIDEEFAGVEVIEEEE